MRTAWFRPFLNSLTCLSGICLSICFIRPARKSGRRGSSASNCMRTQPHAKRADNLRHCSKPRIALRRERLIKVGPRDAGFLCQLHHSPRSGHHMSIGIAYL
jgi:hypothetical protein